MQIILKKKNISKLALPDMPEPTSYSLTKNFYNNADDVINKILQMFGLKELVIPIIRNSNHHDIPGKWFTGPFKFY